MTFTTQFLALNTQNEDDDENRRDDSPLLNLNKFNLPKTENMPFFDGIL